MRENKKSPVYDTGDTGCRGKRMVFGYMWDNFDIHMEKIYLDFYLTLGTKVNSRLSSDLNMKGKIISILEDKERKKERMNKHRSHFKVKEWVPLSTWTMTLRTLRAPRGPSPPCTSSSATSGWLAGCPHHC